MVKYLLSEEFSVMVDDSESSLLALSLLRGSGYEDVVFYDRVKRFSDTEWIEWVKDDTRIVTFLYQNKNMIALVWFDGFSATHRQAYSHFCTFATADRESLVKGGKALLSFMARATPMVQAIGVTPACYRHALSLAYDLGYERVARLTKSVRVHGKERDALVTINNLSTLGV